MINKRSVKDIKEERIRMVTPLKIFSEFPPREGGQFYLCNYTPG